MAQATTSNPKSLAYRITLAAAVFGIVSGLIAVVNFVRPETKAPTVTQSDSSVNGPQIGLNNGTISIMQAPPPITDPRALLSALGTSWSRENFYEALRTGDDRATELFLKGGMKIDGSTFSAFVREWFDGKVAAVILANRNAVDPNACPTLFQVNSPNALALISRSGTSGRFVRSICAIGPIGSDIKTKIDIEQRKLQDAQAMNLTRSSRIQTCIFGIKKKFSVAQFYDHASKFSIFSVTTLATAEQRAIADMNIKLLSGRMGGDVRQEYESSIRSGCEGANPVVSEDAGQLAILKELFRNLND
jgi:hypothetical protein